ncbi:MAG: hypothetical protein AAF743_12860 [Planctomycetota bacterium]
MYRIQSTAIVASLLALPLAHAGTPISDDFDDSVIGSQWSLLEDNPAELSLIEASGQLGIVATGSASNTDDAIYLSNGSTGFRLSTADPFSIAIDYELSAFGDVSSAGDAFGIVFGVGEDLDGQNSAAIGYGVTNIGAGNLVAATVASRTNDNQTIDAIGGSAPDTGTFVIDYVPGTDTLTLTTGGFSTPLVGLVDGTWSADALFVSFGARGGGFSTQPSTAFFDDFRLNSGTVVPIPEPASLGLLTVACIALRRRRG